MRELKVAFVTKSGITLPASDYSYYVSSPCEVWAGSMAHWPQVNKRVWDEVAELLPVEVEKFVFSNDPHLWYVSSKKVYKSSDVWSPCDETSRVPHFRTKKEAERFLASLLYAEQKDAWGIMRGEP